MPACQSSLRHLQGRKERSHERKPTRPANLGRGLAFFGLAGFVGYSLPRPESSKTAEISISKDTNAADKGAQAKQVFTPPRDDEIPDDDFGKMIRLGSDIFHDTQNNANEFVGSASVRELPYRQRPARKLRASLGRIRRVSGVSRQGQTREHISGASTGLLSL